MAYDGAGGGQDETLTVDDPYRCLPTLGEIDLHLIGEGRHEQLWDGARRARPDVRHAAGPVSGTSLRGVGAERPRRAGHRRLRLLGRAGRTRCARSAPAACGSSSCPGVGAGREVQVRDPRPGRRVAGEGRPDGVPRPRAPRRPRRSCTRRTYEWGDDEWMAKRAADPLARRPDEHLRGAPRLLAAGPVLPGAADQLADYLVETGFTHVELMPVAEHPFGGSWGYQVTSYFAPTARFGTPDDFRYLVDRLHQAGIGVIIDWVPGALPQGRVGAGPVRRHPALRARRPAPRRAAGLGHATSSTSAAARCATSWSRTRSTGCEEFHIDGLRVDAVASMLYLDYSRGRRAVDAQPVRRPGEPGGGRLPAGDERDRLPPGARRRDDRRGVHRLARASPGRPTSAASASASSGTWAGCTTRWTTSPRSRSTGSTTTTR